jgi:hypothetical protein
MTNRNTDWKTQVHVPDGPDQMSYRGDFCCGEYATVIVKGYGTTKGSSPDDHVQAGEIVTVDYDVDHWGHGDVDWETNHLPYQAGAAESTLTARPTRVPDLTEHSVTPKVEYIGYSGHKTSLPNPVGVVLVDPFPVDPQNVDGNGPAGDDVWITHVALRGYCLVKDKRSFNTSQNDAYYKPGRLVLLDGAPESFKTGGYHCMVNMNMTSRFSAGSNGCMAIGVYHRVVAWAGTDRDSGHRAGFPGHNTGYAGQDILLIYLTGSNDGGYAA